MSLKRGRADYECSLITSMDDIMAATSILHTEFVVSI